MKIFTSKNGKRHRHRHTNDADEFKRRQMASKRRKAVFSKLLFYALCVIALIVLVAVYYVYTS